MLCRQHLTHLLRRGRRSLSFVFSNERLQLFSPSKAVAQQEHTTIARPKQLDVSVVVEPIEEKSVSVLYGRGHPNSFVVEQQPRGSWVAYVHSVSERRYLPNR